LKASHVPSGRQGCQSFLGTTFQKLEKNVPSDQKYTKGHKIYQMVAKYTKWPNNIYQHLPLHDPPKLIEIGIFGLQIYHLATLVGEREGRGGRRIVKYQIRFSHLFCLLSWHSPEAVTDVIIF
jgi:hypothetical protein